jgi:hypothetical protein
MDEDLLILTYLRQQKLQGIRYLLCRYADSLELIASYYLGDRAEAMYLVGDVVWTLWLEKKFADVDPPLRKFLYKEIHERCKALKGEAHALPCTVAY